MKTSTLHTRYKNLGYPLDPNLSDELQLDAIINWVFLAYNILIVVRPVVGTERHFVNAVLKRDNKKTLKNHLLYSHSSFYMYMEPELVNVHMSPAVKSSFETPGEAKFDALRRIYSHLRFITPFGNVNQKKTS